MLRVPICKKSALIASAGSSEDLAELLSERDELGADELGVDELLGGVDGKGLGTMLELGGIDEPVKLREQAEQPLVISVANSNKTTTARKNRFRFILPLRIGNISGGIPA